jgi:soluble lytic murein transglycosylase-like protein
MNRIVSLLIPLLFPTIALSNMGATDESQQLGLLAKATKLEKYNPWEAASIYCKIARFGSTEAQYRLGMLFAFGQGVPEDRKVAASLFATAAQQGHQEASNMLETIRYSSDKMPDCVLADVKPPHAPEYGIFDGLSLENALTRLSKDRRWLINMVKQIATWHHVDPQLALSIVSVESGFRQFARSNANAMGLMQLIPATAQRFNVKDAFNASQNVKGGVRYLRWLLDRYHGEIELVAAAYNAGEGAVDKYKGIPPYRETQDYVSKVLSRYPHRKHIFNAGSMN